MIVSNATRAEIEQTRAEVNAFLAQELHLELAPEKTTITHVNDGFDFLGFHIQRCHPEGRWVVHLRPTAQNKARLKRRLKELTSRNWTWMDEYTRLASLNRIVAGWCTYYRYTSLVADLEEMTRYTWFRYLQWLLRKYKGSRKHRLIQANTAIMHNRTSWTAQLAQDGRTVTAYQWLPTPKELPRTRYRMKGRLGFPHPYLDPGLAAADHPAWEGGPDATLLTEAIGARSRPGEPLGLPELKLRRKMRDGFRCQRCGSREYLEVHHVGPVTTTAIDDLITLCHRCHRATHGAVHGAGHASKPTLGGEPDAGKLASPVR